MVSYETHEVFSHVLSAEGEQIAKEGSHEARVWSALPAKGQGAPMTPVQLKKQVGDETAKVGQGRAFKNGWIGKEGDGLVKLVRPFNNICSCDLIGIVFAGIGSSRYDTAGLARDLSNWNPEVGGEGVS